MKRRSVVAIHGVGLPKLGSVLTDVQSGLHEVTGHGQREDLVINGVTYPRLKYSSGPIAEIIEVNWADVQRASQNSIGFARHFIYVMNTLLKLGCEKLIENNDDLITPRWYRVLFEGFLVWCLYPSILMLFLLSLDTTLQKHLFSFLLIAFVAATIAYLSRYSGYFKLGYAWVAILIGLVLTFHTNLLPSQVLTKYATYAYAYGQTIVIFTLVLAIVEILIAGIKNHSKEYVLVRLAYLYLPLLAMSAIGAIVWSSSLLVSTSISENKDGYEEWKKVFLESLNYNLKNMEYVFGAAVFLIGLLVLTGIAYYLLTQPKKKKNDAVDLIEDSNRTGLAAQHWISFLLHAMPIILMPVVIYYILSVVVLANSNDPDTNILEVYAWSAMRVAPFIPLLVGPLAILLDVLGDVLFYLLPRDDGHSTRKETKARLKYAVKAAGSSDEIVVVLSHSQGSVVAIDLAYENPNLNMRLITAGSPIDSLHERFLMSSPESRTEKLKQPAAWVNIYREGDYVGGPIAERKGVENVKAGSGGHTGYWKNQITMDWIQKI